MSLRLKIADMFREYPYKEETPGESADAVLALMRDELTSDAAVEAMRSKRVQQPVVNALAFGVALEASDRELLNAALDAITKEPS